MAALIRSAASGLAATIMLTAAAHAQTESEWSQPRQDDNFYEEAYEGEELLVVDDAALSRAHKAYLSDSALQLTRPEEDYTPPPPRPPPADWMRAITDFFVTLAPVFKIIFYLVIALVVIGILYFLFGEAIRMRLGFKRKTSDKPVDDVLIDIRPNAEQARSLLEQADALAREGRFAEAVHLLLFRSIEDIQERLDGGVPTSLTAREIARLGTLPDRARRALAPIIRIVEQSFFGGRAVDSLGWQDARRSYEDFAFGEGWS